MKTGSTMGQAAGTAAAYAVLNKIAPANLTAYPAHVWSIQQQLLRDDAFIIGLVNEDPRDYARTAKVFASSERLPDASSNVNGSATNVITGQTRAVVTPLTDSKQNGGVAPGQGVPGSNRWVSVGLPASLTLAMSQPQPIAQVHLIFDTGMHRKLSFSVVTGGVGVWKAQPETVRDYTIEGRDNQGRFHLLCNVTNNFQRRRVHNVPCDPINPPPSWPPLVPPGPPAPPGPAPPPVAGQAVSMVTCDPSDPTQRWTVAGKLPGRIASASQPGLCLAYDAHAAASGGHGQAVTLLPCAAAVDWSYNAHTANGSFISLPTAVPCYNYTGSCQCVKGVVPQGEPALPSGAAVELWDCQSGLPELSFQQLNYADFNGSSLLSAAGMCLAAQQPRAPALSQRDSSACSHNQHSLQLRGLLPQDAMLYDQIRVNVTATNGVPDAHILEVRLYDEAGKAPFPVKN